MVTTSSPIHRVVTTFIMTTTTYSMDATTTLSQRNLQPKVAIFHRCDTMPTFPCYWAGVSGTIEDGECPYEAAQREISEETNITATVCEKGGPYLDVPFLSPRTQQERTIRVYPFVVHIPVDVTIELRGTEHDRFQMVTIDQLEEMESMCVPGLVQAFHHATYGMYDKSIPTAVRDWANDVQNGASVMTANALQLVLRAEGDDWKAVARHIAMLRPSMVSICNVMNYLLSHGKDSITPSSFQQSLQRSVDLGIRTIEKFAKEKSYKQQLTIATFSRSGTLRQILFPFLERHHVICGQSSPGNEGELMATDLKGSTCLSDSELHSWLAQGKIDLLVIGSDCILPEANLMVNKVGTRKLCQVATENQVPVFCCTDPWKIWNDKFAPPLEANLFEVVPLDLITSTLIASDTDST